MSYKQIDVSFVIPVREDGHVMLGIKKNGLGEGKLTLFGGKLEYRESPQQAVIRELAEEAFVEPAGKLQAMGRLTMDIQNLRLRIVAHIFRCSGVVGEPHESYEMTIEWVPVSEIPFSKMWADNEYWFPYLLDSQPFEGEFVFADPDTLVSHSVRPRTPRSLDALAAAYATQSPSRFELASASTAPTPQQ